MRYLSIISLTIIYGLALAISKLGGLLIKKRNYTKKIIINGTFHNPNWFNAHITPIVNSGYGEVILVTDEPVYQLDNLTYSCPPTLLSKIISRAGAKFIWTLKESFKHRADIHVGYHIFPSAITSLIAAKLTGAKCCYQVTSGPLELAGGGYEAENSLLKGLQTKSQYVENLVNRLVGQFDLVIVRGSKAKKYIEETGFKNTLEVVTGSVLTDKRHIADQRDIDIIFIGRLTEYKRPDVLLECIDQITNDLPGITVKMVGDGPMMGELQALASKYKIESNVEFMGIRKDVVELLGRSKIFVLTSRWEGVSIAMLEAMALGVVPVVLDVGDLSDYVHTEKTGYIFHEDDYQQIPGAIVNLLQNQDMLKSLSTNARQYVVNKCDRDILSKRWLSIFLNLTDSGS